MRGWVLSVLGVATTVAVVFFLLRLLFLLAPWSIITLAAIFLVAMFHDLGRDEGWWS